MILGIGAIHSHPPRRWRRKRMSWATICWRELIFITKNGHSSSLQNHHRAGPGSNTRLNSNRNYHIIRNTSIIID
jgi:hypothetical protein